MKTNNLLKKLFFSTGLMLLCFGVFAQENEKKAKIKIIQDGKTLVDTTYSLDSDKDNISLKEFISSLDLDDIDLDIDVDEILEDIDLDILISGDSKRKVAKKISKENGFITIMVEEDCCEDDGDSKSKKTMSYMISTDDGDFDIKKIKKGNILIDIFDKDEDEDNEIAYVITSKDGDSHKMYNTMKLSSGKKGKLKVMKSDDDEGEFEFHVITGDNDHDTKMIKMHGGHKGATIHKKGGKIFLKSIDGDDDCCEEKENIFVYKSGKNTTKVKGGMSIISNNYKNKSNQFKTYSYSIDDDDDDDEISIITSGSTNIKTISKKYTKGKSIPSVDLSYNTENGKYIIEYSSDSDESVLIKIFDEDGDEIYVKKISDFDGEFKKEIDLGEDNDEFKVKVKQGKKTIETKIVF